MPNDTRRLLGPDVAGCESRSLYLDRFTDPGANDSGDNCPRRDWFNGLRGKPVVTSASSARGEWLLHLARNGRCELFYAQLPSRLMVNMAGGVMENAGSCLDRFGLPYIPGSAVKGCARRMAIQQLLEVEGAPDKSELLAQIALVFGWGDMDWKPERKQKRQGGREIEAEPYSDFWWAMAGDTGKHEADSQRTTIWQKVASVVVVRLLDRLHVHTRKYPDQPWKDLPNFAGVVSFLPAQPVDALRADLPLPPPPLGTMELDVVTCHHPEYYAEKRDRTGNLVMPVALDIEDPNPVIFPAIAAGHVFAFGVLPMRNCIDALLKQARLWLADGLSLFGLGAKTAAGYGWFDCSEGVQNSVAQAISLRQKQEEERR